MQVLSIGIAVGGRSPRWQHGALLGCLLMAAAVGWPERLLGEESDFAGRPPLVVTDRSEQLPTPDQSQAPGSLDQLSREMQALRKRLDQLEKSVKDSTPPAPNKGEDKGKEAPKEEEEKAAEKDPAAKEAPDAELKLDFEETPWTDVSSEKWTVRLGGHVQMDYINWAQASPTIEGDQNYFEFRRLRLVADGVGYGVYDFRLQFTLEPESVGESPPGFVTSPEVKDAYFTIHEVPWFGRVRIGNFFVPFSLEQVTNDTMNIFLERSIPTQGVFAADREVGLACYNATWNQRMTWSSGIFFDSVSESLKEKIDDNQGYRLSSRWTWLPYYDEPSNGRYLLHTGLGVLYTNDGDNRVRFRTRPHVREGPRLIDSGVVPASSYTTGNAELAWVHGRFTVQSEAFLSSVERTTADAALIHGAYLHTSYFLTGECRVFERFGQHGAQFGRNVPYSTFFFAPGGTGPGAWELKMRWAHLNLDNLAAGQYNDMTLGFNWYWSDRTRIMFDWITPYTTKDTVFGSTESSLIGMRFDFNW